jgi:Ni,Fe-hydrogenase maturation factor
MRVGVYSADIRIWAVEVDDVSTFSEDLTPEVLRAVPLVVEDVAREVEASAPGHSGRGTP